MLYNDSTKIVTLTPDLFHFCYIERIKNSGTDQPTENVQYYNFFDYPASIEKKVVLLQHFKSYLEGNSKFRPLQFDLTKENAPKRPLTMEVPGYIKKWKRARKAIVLRSSNKVIQVLFQDQSELVLASGSGVVTFINAKKEIKECLLNCDRNLELEDPSLFKRL